MRLTIDITGEQLQHLKALQNDFAYQIAHDQAEFPNVYVLVNVSSIVVNPDFEGDADVQFCDLDKATYDMSLKDLPAHLEDCYPEKLASFRAAHPDFDWDSNKDMNALLEEFPHIYKIHCALRPYVVQTFLTRQSAENHLKANRHHYHEQAFIERRKVWRDPGMKELIWMLYHIPVDSEVMV